MTLKLNKAKSFYKKAEKSSVIENKDPMEIVRTMIKELKKSMHIVVTSTGKQDQNKVRTKHYSRSLVIIYTLQTSLDFEKGQDLAGKLFQIYEYCRKELIKCFSQRVIDGIQKAITALSQIFEENNRLKNA